MAKDKTVWFGMKVTSEQKEKIRYLADRHGISAKEVVMRLVEAEFDEEEIEIRKGSFADGIEHILGSIEAPPDLSTNPDYLKGFGR